MIVAPRLESLLEPVNLRFLQK